MTRSQIDIIGAGIAGLTAALAFCRRGYSVVVREQADELQEVGAGVQLSPNATRILFALGLESALDPVMHRPPTIGLVSGLTLAPVARVPAGQFAEARWGAPYGVIHRADLQKVLLAAVRAEAGCRLELGSRVGPGDLSTAALTVIADGVWSTNRERIQTAGRPVFTGQVAWRFLIAADRAADFLEPANVTAFLGPESHLVAYPVKGGEVVNMVAITSGDAPGRDWNHRSSAENRAGLAERFHRWHPKLRETMLSTGEMTFWPLYQLEDGRYFNGGKAVLIGDAAHAMAPYAAQGAAMAIEDAWELAAAFASSGRTGLSGWESARRDRVGRARNRAAFNRFAYHARGPLRIGRDIVLSLRRPEDLARDFDWLYGWRATGL